MGNVSRADIVETLSSMTVLEISDLVKELETKFGVTAAMPMAMAAMPVAAAAAVAEEKTEFNVILETVGAEKIQVIKVVRELTGLGLKEAKALVDGAPGTIKEAASKEEADKMKAKLAEVGATVAIK